jgi:hypothetical protein
VQVLELVTALNLHEMTAGFSLFLHLVSSLSAILCTGTSLRPNGSACVGQSCCSCADDFDASAVFLPLSFRQMSLVTSACCHRFALIRDVPEESEVSLGGYRFRRKL